MKKAILTTALLAIGVCATIGFTHRNGGRQSVNTRLNIKELPEHGLTLIKSTDAYYKQVMSTTSQNQLNGHLEALRPFSVLLQNNSNKTLIAFKLKWEILSVDGQVLTTRNGYMNSKRLFNTKDKSKTKSILEPNSTLFCTVIGVADVNQLASAQLGLRATIGQRDDDESVQQAAQNNSPDEAIDKLIKQLSESGSVTVSIDGALFDDGTFVGPDSSNFFGWLSSLIEARRDLLQNLKATQQEGNPDKVHKCLEEAANNPEINLGPKSSSDDFYRFNRKHFAQRLLKKKNALGDDAIRKELESLNDRWLNLRKL